MSMIRAETASASSAGTFRVRIAKPAFHVRLLKVVMKDVVCAPAKLACVLCPEACPPIPVTACLSIEQMKQRVLITVISALDPIGFFCKQRAGLFDWSQNVAITAYP